MIEPKFSIGQFVAISSIDCGPLLVVPKTQIVSMSWKNASGFTCACGKHAGYMGWAYKLDCLAPNLSVVERDLRPIDPDEEYRNDLYADNPVEVSWNLSGPFEFLHENCSPWVDK